MAFGCRNRRPRKKQRAVEPTRVVPAGQAGRTLPQGLTGGKTESQAARDDVAADVALHQRSPETAEKAAKKPQRTSQERA
ncbi:hypothetical protein HYPGJ_31629 [Hyphomicrobium sp. GJ21]|nr:hypothetical protein HYPGJ_31629 [Hyphomicrobium sp. GJ21]